MNVIKPLVLSFSLIAFASAYAQDAKKEDKQAQTPPAATQSDSKKDEKTATGSATTGASGSAATGAAGGASATPPAAKQDDAKKDDKGAAATGGMKKDDDKAAAGMKKDDDKAAAGATRDKGAKAGANGAEMSAKRLIGRDVVDAQGKQIGEISDVIVDLNNGRLHAVVLEFGGFLGLGEKHYAFPVTDLKPAKEKDKFTLASVDKEKLKNEGFEKSKWPEMNDQFWGRFGDKGAAAGGTAGQKVNLHRASKLIGQDVQDKSGKEIGEIQDIGLSSDTTRIEFIVLDVKGAGRAQIEPKQLSLGTDNKLIVDVSADQLKGQAGKRDKQAQSERTAPMASGGAAAGASAGMKKDDDKPSAGATAGAKKDDKSSVSVKQDDKASAGASADAKKDDKAGASATGGATAGQKTFSELDKDNDGTLSQMEAAADANAKSNFEKLDKNNDKKLSREEFQAGQGAAAGATGAGGKGGTSGSAGAAGKPEQPKSK